jgi:quinol monooxygenase YgiN
MEENRMSLRLVITLTAAPGKGAEFAEALKARCEDVMKEPGCEQFEVFRSAVNPDKLVLLEHWTDQAALDAHGKVNATRAPLPDGLRSGVPGEREDYEYNRRR